MSGTISSLCMEILASKAIQIHKLSAYLICLFPGFSWDLVFTKTQPLSNYGALPAVKAILTPSAIFPSPPPPWWVQTLGLVDHVHWAGVERNIPCNFFYSIHSSLSQPLRSFLPFSEGHIRVGLYSFIRWWNLNFQQIWGKDLYTMETINKGRCAKDHNSGRRTLLKSLSPFFCSTWISPHSKPPLPLSESHPRSHARLEVASTVVLSTRHKYMVHIRTKQDQNILSGYSLGLISETSQKGLSCLYAT